MLNNLNVHNIQYSVIKGLQTLYNFLYFCIKIKTHDQIFTPEVLQLEKVNPIQQIRQKIHLLIYNLLLATAREVSSFV